MTGGLLQREIAFFDALRAAGVPVALSEVLDATRAMGVVDLLDREALRQAFAATAVKRPNHRAAYDRLYPEYQALYAALKPTYDRLPG